MFTTLIVQPIINLLTIIMAVLPGHNFGLAVIIFTILLRLLMWPMLRKQLHHAKAMRSLQPEIKKIKAAAKGDRQKESRLMMELYKEREIKPFASLGLILVQAIILIGLLRCVTLITQNPHNIVRLSYPFVHHLGWVSGLAANIHNFDHTLLGTIDLTRSATGAAGLYIPALIIVIASAIAQYYQGRQLLPRDKDSRSLRSILSEAGQGKSADQQEVNAAVGKSTLYLIPVLVLLFSIHFASALPLYWLVASLVVIIQQHKILGEDQKEVEQIIDEPSPKRPKTKKSPKKHKRRKK